MRKGYLSEYFQSVAAKRLSAVEVSKKVSKQHEFNGSIALQRALGTTNTGEKVFFDATFIWLADDQDPVRATGKLTWYDARFEVESRDPEWRLYFPTTDVSQRASAGDLLVVARAPSNRVFCIIAEAGSTVESQLFWLFHVPVQAKRGFVFQDISFSADKEIIFPVAYILESLGVEIQEEEDQDVQILLEKFQGKLPTTKIFSDFTRKCLKDVNPLDDPDTALMAWMSHEEKLFRLMERHQVENRLKEGFIADNKIDVDGFVSFSLSVHNTRKSRAGLALENHLEQIFKLHHIKYDRGKPTENKNKPDFLFPGFQEYQDPLFDSERLSMLGVKTSCKDRWRQVLPEAERVKKKHLLTLEPGISENQTNEMRSHNLQLVLPKGLHETYKATQRSWLMSLKDFVMLITDKQRSV